MAITFEPADARRDRTVLTEFNVAYLDWLDANIQHTFGLVLPALLGQPITEYVAATLDKLCAGEPPEGVFYVVRRDGSVVGMGGVRRTDDEASEMKRVFEGFRDRPIYDGAEVPSQLHHDWRFMERSLR